MKAKLILPFIVVFTFVFFLSQNSRAQNNWPQWRGPNGTGAIEKGDPPIEFSETKNLKWKTAIPGKGHATPIVWEDNIILQTALETDEKIDALEAYRPRQVRLRHWPCPCLATNH